LPSFYSLLAGVCMSWLHITLVVPKGTASNAILLLGILPIYVAVVMGPVIFEAPADILRLDELRTAWTMQAVRVREMDRLLARIRNAAPASVAPGPPSTERQRSSELAIRQNLGRLRNVRERTLQNLLETLACVRELVSMIHLAKFTGAPASLAKELVARIATAVEGISLLSWQQDSDGTASWHDRSVPGSVLLREMHEKGELFELDGQVHRHQTDLGGQP
jgi:hypothetical protein